MKPPGVLYFSVKVGDGEWVDAYGRLFVDYDEAAIRAMATKLPSLTIERIWETTDLRPGRDDKWLNVVCRKFGAPR
jgi:hypothetical protein